MEKEKETIWSIIGKKWVIDVLSVIHKKKSAKFGEIISSLCIPPSTLDRILKTLQRHKIIQKEVLGLSPLFIQYMLSKKGYDLFLYVKKINNLQF